MAVQQKRRRWPDDEKRSICLQTTAPGVSVAQVARRYAMNANLIFKWLRDERYAPAVDVVQQAGSPEFCPSKSKRQPAFIEPWPPLPQAGSRSNYPAATGLQRKARLMRMYWHSY